MNKRWWVLLLILTVLGMQDLHAQQCSVAVAGFNQNRYVYGPTKEECPGEFPPHSMPFGNWGATSNFGHKEDGNQFQGWCHDHWATDNFGNTEEHCTDDWYEWNSCTFFQQWAPPNSTLYNVNDDEQETT